MSPESAMLMHVHREHFRDLSDELTQLCTECPNRAGEAAQRLLGLSSPFAAALALDVHQSLTVSYGSIRAAYWRTAVGKLCGMDLL